jgi:hypothetical protein
LCRGGQHPEFDDEVRFAIYEDIEDVLARKKLSDGPDKDGGVAVSSSTGSTGITRSPSKKGIVMQLFADDSKEPKIIGETVIDLTPVLKLGEHDGEERKASVPFLSPDRHMKQTGIHCHIRIAMLARCH